MTQATCDRCGNPPLCDYVCADCGEYLLTNEDEGADFENGILYETVNGSDGPERGDRITCGCGCEDIEEEAMVYCSWCQHQVDKDKD